MSDEKGKLDFRKLSERNSFTELQEAAQTHIFDKKRKCFAIVSPLHDGKCSVVAILTDIYCVMSHHMVVS